MGIQKVIMSNPSLAMKFMSTAPSSFHVRSGHRHAVATLNEAVSRTVAYPRVLEEHGVDLPANPSFEDFEQLPIIDKKTYVERFGLLERVLDGRLATGYTLETSSGHSGAAHYWPRTADEDEIFPTYMEFAFRQFYGIAEKATLIIISLALGTWTSGEKMSQALRQIAASGRYRMTVVSPGTDSDEILRIVQEISPSYDQTVLVGYPPFVKHVLDEGEARGMDWKDYRMRLGLGGEGYSEEWRSFMSERIGVDPDRDLLAVSGGYGAADLGMSVGREYPLTVLIRRLASRDRRLAAALFSHGVPNLLQYSPTRMYVEEVGGELVFTARAGIPLVRYNIHDSGGVLGFDHVMEMLGDFGYEPAQLLSSIGYSPEHVWRLPFFYCYGRSDGTVSVCGALVYPEHVSAALSLAKDTAVLGHKSEVVTEADFGQKFHIHLEMRADFSDADSASMTRAYQDSLFQGLQAVNPEYADASKRRARGVVPVVHVHRVGCGPFAEDVGTIKHRYTT